MKLVLLVHQAAELYGSDKVLLYIAEGLLKGGRFWPVVVVPTDGPLVGALRALGVEVHISEVAKITRAAFTPRGLFRLAVQAWTATSGLDRLLAGRRVAVVHSNTLAVVAGAVFAWRRGAPHLWHVHEIIQSPRLVSRAYPRLVRWMADRVVSNSTLTEQWLLQEQPSLAQRSVVVFNGLPPQQPVQAQQAADFRQSLNLPPDSTLLVVAGRINSWKGQGLLLQALAQLKQNGQLGGLCLAIVGDTPPGQPQWLLQLQAQVAALGLSDVVRFVKFVDDIRPVWAAADIAVVPSTEPEPFGMVAIEAMAAGVPVVAAAHGGLLDIVVDGESGLLFTPRDADALAVALDRLNRSPEWRHTLGERGRFIQQQRFSAATQVTALEAVYAAMADLGSPR
jgi:glycosyltransferase involved in cell wall biosynthesis